ncbi:MAG: hypothetical protein IPL55_00250 [Saprospiraceae bacterium]|nr:hypothetical protein [Saprospiraceae bacterium]
MKILSEEFKIDFIPYNCIDFIDKLFELCNSNPTHVNSILKIKPESNYTLNSEFENILNNIDLYISTDDLTQLFNFSRLLITKNSISEPNAIHTVYGLMVRYNLLNEKIRMGILSPENIKIENNELVISILEIIQTIIQK